MTHRPIREVDGVRIYADGHRYRPKAPEERAYGVRKPDNPEAVRFHGQWFEPLRLADMASRTMPETRPDDETLQHRAACRCSVCSRPQAQLLWLRQTKRGTMAS